MPGIDRRPSGSGGGGTPSGSAGGDLTGTYPDPTLNAPTAAVHLGLGKYVASGYNSLPTWIPSTAADWADVVANSLAWIQFDFSVSGAAVIRAGIGADAKTSVTAGSTGSEVRIVDPSNDGFVNFVANPSESSVTVFAKVGQTAPTINLYDNDSNEIFQVAPDGSGIYLPLGKVVAVGYNSTSTLFDPASTLWDDKGWVHWGYESNGIDLYLGSGPNQRIYADFQINQVDAGGGNFYRISNGTWHSALADNSKYQDLTVESFMLSDGSNGGTSIAIESDLAGRVVIVSDRSKVQLKLKAHVGQTDPLLDLQNSTTSSILSIIPDGSIGGAKPGTGDKISWDGAKYVVSSTTAVPAFSTNAIVLGTAAAAGVATTVIRSDATIAAFDATTPSTQALGDTGTVGTAAFAARRDHKHVMPVAADIYAAAQSVDTVTATTYTYVIGDAGKLKQHSAATAISATIPPNSTTAFAIGTHIDVAQVAVGQVTFTTAAGVTMISNPAVPHTTTSAVASLIKVASDTWIVAGYIV